MDLPLDPTECRILGVLIEKQLATPEYYPLTVNALVSGCNQKNNRDPVTHYQDFEIEGALRSLYIKKLVTNSNLSGRAIKWLHRVDEMLGLDRAQLAVLAELMLRGPQQPGELRARASRMAEPELNTQDSLLAILDKLAAMVPPLARNFGRRPGERADRWGQLLGGEPEMPPPEIPSVPAATLATAPSPLSRGDLERRMEALEARIAAIEEKVDRLASELRGPAPA